MKRQKMFYKKKTTSGKLHQETKIQVTQSTLNIGAPDG